MAYCMHCGIQIRDDATICNACEWIHLGIRPDIAALTVARAKSVISFFDQHYMVSTIDEVHQLMVDLMVGCSDDDADGIMFVGCLREILWKATVEELAERGYSPDGMPL